MNNKKDLILKMLKDKLRQKDDILLMYVYLNITQDLKKISDLTGLSYAKIADRFSILEDFLDGEYHEELIENRAYSLRIKGFSAEDASKILDYDFKEIDDFFKCLDKMNKGK